MIRFLTEHDVAQALAGVDVAALMADALRAYSSGAAVQPARTALVVGPDHGYVGLMPAYLPGAGALGAKLVSVFGRNRERGLPTHYATVVLLDAATGELQAVMDGRLITEVRTAAVSAVAAGCLADGPIRTLALFGCGVQARSHLRALMPRLPALERVRVWSPLAELEPFVREMQAELGDRIAAGGTDSATASGADLTVLVTSATEPVLSRAWVRPGALVISVGACRPTHRELDPALVAEARVFVDSREGALAESGDIVQGIAEGRFGPDHLRGELGEALLGRVTPREAAADRVIFKSLGLGVEDVAVADVVYRRALDAGLGTTLAF